MGSLTFVGLGLWDERDVSLRGLEATRNADQVFLEAYTAFLAGTTRERMEALYDKPVEPLDRDAVETGDRVLDAAREGDVVVLVPGDALTATTHVDMLLRAREAGIATHVVPGASVVTAVPGLLGLQSYKFGRSTTLVFPEPGYFPTSPYDVVASNLERGLHTLVLLDIRADEDRCMRSHEGADLLLRMEDERGEGVLDEGTLVAAVARAGSPEPRAASGPLSVLRNLDLGPPLHALVVPGDLHFLEEEALIALTEHHSGAEADAQS